MEILFRKQSTNEEHMKIVNEMGITVDVLSDGRVQLLHTFSNAKSVSDAEEGLLFMQEMVELSKSQSSDTLPQSVSFVVNGQKVVLSAGPAHFGKQLRNADKVIGRVGVAHPLRACEPLTNPEWLHGRIGIVERGDCMFVEKARKLASAGAIGGIVVDNVPGSSAGGSPMFAMSGDGIDNVDIPVVFLFSQDAWRLLQALAQNPVMLVTLGDTLTEAKSETEGKTDDETSTLQKLKGSVQDFLFVQQDKPIIESVGKPEVTLVDIGDVSSGQEMIRISRRDAYLSSEGTAVVPPAVLTRETLHALLLEMLSKPQSGLDEDISAKDDIVQVTSQNRIGVKSPDEL